MQKHLIKENLSTNDAGAIKKLKLNRNRFQMEM